MGRPIRASAQDERRFGVVVGGKWRIDSLLGRGATSSVYAATHLDGTRGAVKMLRAPIAMDPNGADELRIEAHLASAVSHPSIIRTLDEGITEDGYAFIVLELIDGESLEERRERRGGRLPLHEAMAIGRALMDALSALHDAGLVHRDLKPENVLLGRDGQVKLIDFGLARRAIDDARAERTDARVVGTPSFMPPEQALGYAHRMDAQSDIWALGALLFFILAGQPVHPERAASTLVVTTASTPARSLAEAAGELPAAVVGVVDRALRFRKSERWPDMRAMREAWKAAYPDWLPTIPPAPLGSVASDFGEPTLVVGTPMALMTPRAASFFDPRELVNDPDLATGKRPMFVPPAASLDPVTGGARTGGARRALFDTPPRPVRPLSKLAVAAGIVAVCGLAWVVERERTPVRSVTSLAAAASLTTTSAATVVDASASALDVLPARAQDDVAAWPLVTVPVAGAATNELAPTMLPASDPANTALDAGRAL